MSQNGEHTADKGPVFQSVHPHYHKLSSWRGRVLVLEGLIGVGKSTLGQSITNYLNSIGIETMFFNEFVNEPLLELYLTDRKKYAFPFQVIMLRERINIYRRAWEIAKKGKFCIIDRSIYGDMAFAQMQKNDYNFTDKEWCTYMSLIKIENLPKPSATIFLDCEPVEAFRRMQVRSIQAEVSSYSLEYFENLYQNYLQIMTEYQCDFIVLDWNVPKEIVDPSIVSTGHGGNQLSNISLVCDQIRELFV